MWNYRNQDKGWNVFLFILVWVVPTVYGIATMCYVAFLLSLLFGK